MTRRNQLRRARGLSPLPAEQPAAQDERPSAADPAAGEEWSTAHEAEITMVQPAAAAAAPEWLQSETALLAKMANKLGLPETPTPEVLRVWLSQCPEGVAAEAGRLAGLVMGASDEFANSWRWFAGVGPDHAGWRPMFDAPLLAQGPMADGGLWVGGALTVTESWFQAAPAGERGWHPLTPILLAWAARPTQVEPYRPTGRASLPQLHRVEATERLRTMPGLYGEQMPSGQLTLPGVPAPEGLQCVSGLLSLYDGCGGPLHTQGRGAPWALRLFVGAMLHLPVGQRDGEWRALRFPLAEVESWLHPGGWDKSNRWKYWRRLPEALAMMARDMGWLNVPGIGLVRIVHPSVIPSGPDAPFVEFSIRIPRQAARGDRIDWPTLCRYGKDSAALYRAYLAAATIMGQSARNGQPITRQIAAPVFGPDNKPVRCKGGKIRRDPSVRADNPSARYVLGLSDADLAGAIGFDGRDRRYRALARKAFERLHSDGVIELVKDSGKWRIFGPASPS